MITLSSCLFLSSIGTSIANIALPNLSQAFSATYAEIQWVIISYLLANTIFIVAVGKIGDMLGRQKVLGIGLLIFAISSFLCGLSQCLWELILGRALQGVGSAILMALTVALASDLIPGNRLGRMMGFLGTASAVGTAVGPSLGGLIISFFGWNYIFFFIGSLGIIIFVLSYQFIPMSSAGNVTHKNKSESNVTIPIFRNAPLLSSFFMNVCVSTVMMSTLVVGPFYLSETLHLGSILVGTVMTVGPLASILSGVVAGRAVDSVGPSKVLFVGLSFIVMGCLLFTILPSQLGVAGYVISAAILSPGYQMFQAGNNSMVMSGTSAHQKGFISGILSLSRNSGLIIGASGMGMIFSRYGMEKTFLVAGVIALTALFFGARRTI